MPPNRHASSLLFVLCLSAVWLLAASASADTPVFINEIHYDNVDADADEGVEIGGPAGTDLTGWRVRLYNGTNGTAYGVIVLAGELPDLCNFFGTLWFPELGVQNGAPDGLALVDDLGNVRQFISYEGTITATDWEAAGLTSTDIGVAEDGTTPVGTSLQLVGVGTNYEDFVWMPSVASSHSACNAGQDPTTDVGGTPGNLLAISSYPNPFNPQTTIQYTVPSRGQVLVAVYDSRGSLVTTLVREESSAGVHSVSWAGTDASGQGVSSGVYFARIEHGGVTRTQKLVLLK
jgi:hypothetical protein